MKRIANKTTAPPIAIPAMAPLLILIVYALEEPLFEPLDEVEEEEELPPEELPPEEPPPVMVPVTAVVV